MSPTCDTSTITSRILMDEIQELDAYFENLINKIPAKIFYNKNEEIIQTIENKKRKKFEDSNNQKNELSNKTKNKRLKLDPTSHQTVSDVAKEFAAEPKEMNGKMNDLRKKLAKRISELREFRMDKKNKSCSNNVQQSPKEEEPINETMDEDMKNMPKIFNKQGDLVFSKFDLTSQIDLAAQREMEKLKAQKKKQKQKNKQSLKGLLVKAKKTEAKLDELKQTDSKAAEQIKKEKIWQTVLEKSEGNKVRDDPRLLQKSLKKQEKKKSKSAKLWNERKDAVQKQQQHQQERRQRMIDERKTKRKERRLKRRQKKLKLKNKNQ